MNVIPAMEDTLALARQHNLHNLYVEEPSTSYEHLVELYERANEGALNNTLSDAKLNRWLGWMQACVVINSGSGGGATVEDMKEINRRWSDD